MKIQFFGFDKGLIKKDAVLVVKCSKSKYSQGVHLSGHDFFTLHLMLRSHVKIVILTKIPFSC